MKRLFEEPFDQASDEALLLIAVLGDDRTRELVDRELDRRCRLGPEAPSLE